MLSCLLPLNVLPFNSLEYIIILIQFSSVWQRVCHHVRRCRAFCAQTVHFNFVIINEQRCTYLDIVWQHTTYTRMTYDSFQLRLWVLLVTSVHFASNNWQQWGSIHAFVVCHSAYLFAISLFTWNCTQKVCRWNALVLLLEYVLSSITAIAQDIRMKRILF